MVRMVASLFTVFIWFVIGWRVCYFVALAMAAWQRSFIRRLSGESPLLRYSMAFSAASKSGAAAISLALAIPVGLFAKFAEQTWLDVGSGEKT